MQTQSFPFDSALHQTRAAGYPTLQVSEPCDTGAPFWPHGVLLMDAHQSSSTAGLGLEDLWQPESSSPCVGTSTGPICGHQLLSSAAWVSNSRTGLLVSQGLCCERVHDCAVPRVSLQLRSKCASVVYERSNPCQSPCPRFRSDHRFAPFHTAHTGIPDLYLNPR